MMKNPRQIDNEEVGLVKTLEIIQGMLDIFAIFTCNEREYELKNVGLKHTRSMHNVLASLCSGNEGGTSIEVFKL